MSPDEAFPMANDPVPPEELEMAVEEMTGKPLPGKPEERLAALKLRIGYLEMLLANTECCDQTAIVQDLIAAKSQLAQWQAQHEGRN